MSRQPTTSTSSSVAHAVLEVGRDLGSVWVLFRDTPSGGALALRAWGQVPSVEAIAELCRTLGVPTPREAAAVPDSIRAPLSRFAAGEPVDLASVPVELTGSAFQIAVYSALRRVERGHVRTYARLSSDAGRPRAMRAVGQAMSNNPLPLVVPCHRVIGSGGALGGYTGGVDKKRILLGLEGVAISADRVIAGQLELLPR